MRQGIWFLIFVCLMIPQFVFAEELMTLDDVVKLSQAGIKDELIIGQIIATESQFKLTTDDIIFLKDKSVSDELLDFLINTPTLENWQVLEDKWADSDSTTIESTLSAETETEDAQNVYQHVYVTVDYWHTLHPYWYWDTFWDGIYPIGYYCHNGRYYYYFGGYYWYYHPHADNRYYPPNRYKPPRGDRSDRHKSIPAYSDRQADRRSHRVAPAYQASQPSRRKDGGVSGSSSNTSANHSRRKPHPSSSAQQPAIGSGSHSTPETRSAITAPRYKGGSNPTPPPSESQSRRKP